MNANTKNKYRKHLSHSVIKCAFLAIVAFLTVFSAELRAQQPSPTATATIAPTPNGRDSNLSDYLSELTVQSIAFKDSLSRTFEQPLVGWFLQISNYLGFIVFGFFTLRKVFKGEMDFNGLKKQVVIFTVCLLGLIWCGDVNGDGKFGDLVNKLQGLGNSLAFGYSPNTPNGNYLGGLVNQQRIKFDENYEKFVENKMMVRIEAQDMPIRYPGMEGIQKLAGLYTGKPLTEAEKAEMQTSAFWMSVLFQFLSGCRWIVEGIDYILFFIVFLTIMAVRMFLPFAFAVISDDGLAKRITFPFLWSTFTLTVVCPLIAQICRLLIFVCGNIGLGLSNSNPHFSFDPTTGTIVGNGNPEWTILIAGVAMLLSLGFLLFSIVISYKLMQGALVEAVTGLATQMFGMAASTGIQFGVQTVANNLNQQAERTSADATLAASQTQADYAQQSQIASAQAALDANKTAAATTLAAENVMSGATATASRQSSFGSMVSGMMNAGGEKYEKSATSLADLQQNWATMTSEQKRDSAMNALDLLSKNNDLFTREGQQRIRDEVEKLNLPGDQLNQALGMIPVVGSALKTLGVNGEALNPILRSDTGRTVLGAMLSAATNGGIPTPGGAIIMQSADLSSGIPFLTKTPENSGLGTYTKDGATFDQSQFPQPENNALQTVAPPSQPPRTLSKPPSNFSSLSAPQMSKLQKNNLAALQGVMKSDPNFLPTLQRESRKRGINPNDMLNMIAIESSFRKNVMNPDGYLGLGQVGVKERQSLSNFGWTGNNAIDKKRVESMTPSQQLESLVFPFVDKKFNNPRNGLSMDKMYAGWGSGHYKNDPNYIHMERGGKRSGAYSKNPAWDFNHDGKVQQWEFGATAPKTLGAGVFFDANQAAGSLRFYDPATSKVMAAKFAREYELGRGMQNNQFSYAGKESINSAYYGDKRGIMVDRYNAAQTINDNVAAIKENAIQTNYGWSLQASDTILSGSRQSASIRNEGSLKSADITFAGAQKAANLSHTGQMKASEIQHDAAIRAMNLKALSNGVSQIGGSLSHAVSELTERSSRL